MCYNCSSSEMSSDSQTTAEASKTTAEARTTSAEWPTTATIIKQEPVVVNCDIKVEEGEIIISREPGEIPSSSKHDAKHSKEPGEICASSSKHEKEHRKSSKSSKSRRHKSSRSHRRSKSTDQTIDSILNMPVHKLSEQNKYSGMYVRCGNTMISVPRPSRHRARWSQAFPGPPPILRQLPLQSPPPEFPVLRSPPARRTSKERLDANIAKVAQLILIELA